MEKVEEEEKKKVRLLQKWRLCMMREIKKEIREEKERERERHRERKREERKREQRKVREIKDFERKRVFIPLLNAATLDERSFFSVAVR
jgi:hypothetical protein